MKDENTSHVAIVGAGLMGLGIGLEFARFGYEVNLYDTKENFGERALKQAREELDLMVETELITAADAGAAMERLHPLTDMEKAVSGAGYVVEAVFDVLSLKQDIFARLDELCPPPAILATNTTSLRVSDIALKAAHPGRILTTHYFQPPHFMPLVEVVGGEKTERDTIERAANVLRGLRKKVVVLNRDTNMLAGTRLQNAMSDAIKEIIEMGITDDFHAIDDVISYGFGRRLAYTANFKRLDLIGLDFLYTTMKSAGLEVWKPIAERAERGDFGMKSGKGFYDWPGDSAQKVVRRLNLGLIQLMKEDIAEGNI